MQDLRGEGVEEIAPADLLRNLVFLRPGQDEVGLDPGNGGLPVLHRALVDALVVFDSDDPSLCPVAQEEAHPTLAAAVVQHHIALPEKAAARQPLQHGVGGGLVGVVVLVGVGVIPAAGLNLQELVPGVFCHC